MLKIMIQIATLPYEKIGERWFMGRIDDDLSDYRGGKMTPL